MQRRVGEQAARDVRRGARELAEQTTAYAAAADADSDRQRAQHGPPNPCWPSWPTSSNRLLRTGKIRRAEQSAERGV